MGRREFFNYVDKAMVWFHSAGIHRNWVIRIILTIYTIGVFANMAHSSTGLAWNILGVILVCWFWLSAIAEEIGFKENKDLMNTNIVIQREQNINFYVTMFILISTFLTQTLTIVALEADFSTLGMIAFMVYVVLSQSLMPTEPPAKIFEKKLVPVKSSL